VTTLSATSKCAGPGVGAARPKTGRARSTQTSGNSVGRRSPGATPLRPRARPDVNRRTTFRPACSPTVGLSNEFFQEENLAALSTTNTARGTFPFRLGEGASRRDSATLAQFQARRGRYATPSPASPGASNCRLRLGFKPQGDGTRRFTQFTLDLGRPVDKYSARPARSRPRSNGPGSKGSTQDALANFRHGARGRLVGILTTEGPWPLFGCSTKLRLSRRRRRRRGSRHVPNVDNWQGDFRSLLREKRRQSVPAARTPRVRLPPARCEQPPKERWACVSSAKIAGLGRFCEAATEPRRGRSPHATRARGQGNRGTSAGTARRARLKRLSHEGPLLAPSPGPAGA